MIQLKKRIIKPITTLPIGHTFVLEKRGDIFLAGLRALANKTHEGLVAEKLCATDPLGQRRTK